MLNITIVVAQVEPVVRVDALCQYVPVEFITGACNPLIKGGLVYNSV